MTILASNLLTLLNNFVRAGQLGVVAGETLFRLWADGPQRRPDIAFVSAGRVRSAPPVDEDPAAWEVVPDLAVEVISPTNSAEEVQVKVNEYFRAGVRAVWVIFPRQRQVMVYNSPLSSCGVQEPGTLEAGPVLPGFTVSLTELFADPTRPVQS